MRLFSATILALVILAGCAAPAAPAPTAAPPTSAPKAAAPPAPQPTTAAPAPQPTAAAPAAQPKAAAPTAAPASAPQPQLVSGKLPAMADGFPNRPITLWTPQSPGHSDDIFNKMFAEVADKFAPVRIPTSTRVSGPGLEYAHADFLKTQPGADEGYHVWSTAVFGPTLRLYTIEAIKDRKIEDVRPLILVESAPFVFVVPNDSPFKSLKDVIDFAKANELKTVAATTGSGLHVTLGLWQRQAGIKTAFVPTQDAAQTKTVLLGGGARFGVLTYDPGLEQSLRIVAVTGDKRAGGGLKDVPSLKELGFNVPAGSERAIATMPSVSDNRANWLYQLLALVTKSPEFAAKRPGFELSAKTGAEVNQMKRDILELYVPVVRELGLAVK